MIAIEIDSFHFKV